MKYYLGIDPGLSEVGFGIVRAEKNRVEFVDCGIFKTTPKNTFPERLKMIKDDLLEILKLHSYEAVGVEELFFAKNVTNAIKVSHARGVIIETLFEARIPILEFKPNEIKRDIAGYGAADKPAMQEMVRRLLNLKEKPKPPDAADALAIAIMAGRVSKRG